MSQLLKKILAAGRLVKSGKLVEATAAIQRALANAPTAPVASRPSAPKAAAPSPAATTVEVLVAEPPDADEVLAAEPAVVVERPRTARFEESSFTCAAGTRSFKLFEPPRADAGPRPLVVMLHGCTQDPDDFAAGTRMNALAAAEGVYVLYPAQAPRSNAHKCWNWFVPADQRRGKGEPALIAGMTRHVMQTHAIDADRVFVAGLSAGGAMAAILAREYPDLFAAAGVHSGIAPGAAQDVASAFSVMKAGPGRVAAWPATTPVIVFHGDADATVAAANGDAVVTAALAGQPGMRSDSEGQAGPRGFRRSVWHAEGASGAPSVAEQWVIRGAPHAWSGGAAAGSYTDPSGPDASREMLRFFLEHPRGGAAG